MLVGAGLLTALSSCGSSKSLYPVRGSVFVNKKPAEGALVVFHRTDDPEGKAPRPRGTVQVDGSFTLTTYAKDDGAPPGDYVVTINWIDLAKSSEEQSADKLKGHYTNRQTSKLLRRVEAGANEFPFELKE